MATYVNDLRLKEIATGDESGTWGTSTNTNLELIGEALGYSTEGITTNADTHTTTVADGSTDPGRAMYIKYTGTLDSACTITIAPNTMSRVHIIENGTSGSQNIIISQGSGANITIPAGDVKVVYLDGAGSGAAVVDAFASLNVVDLKVEDDLTFTSDSAVITFGADGDTTLTHTDGSGLTLNSTNKIMFNDASQFIQGSSATVLALGATDEIDLTATAIDVNGTMDVSGLLTAAGKARITDVGNATVAGLQFTDAGLGISSPSTDQLNFITADATRFSISSAGTVTFEHPIVLQSGATQGLYIENNAGNATTPRITNDANDHTIIRPGKSSGAVQWNNFANDAELMRLTDAGNLGLGVVPEAWSSTWQAFRIGDRAAVYSQANSTLGLSENVYYDSGGWKAIDTAVGSLMQLDSGGVFFYHNASVSAGATASPSIRWKMTSTEMSVYSATGNSQSGAIDVYGTNGSAYGGSSTPRSRFSSTTDGSAYGSLLGLWTTNASNVLTQSITIDSSQQVGIGTTSPDNPLDIEYTASNHTTGIHLSNKTAGGYGNRICFNSTRSDNSALEIAATIRSEGQTAWNSNANENSQLVFSVDGASTLSDRMFLNYRGALKVRAGDSAATFASGTDYTHEIWQDQAGYGICKLATSGGTTNQYGVMFDFADDVENTSNWFLRCMANTDTRLYIYSNGNIYNKTGTGIQQSSDRRLKDNIADYSGGLTVLNSLTPRTYTWKEGQGTAGTQYGFVAQEIEEASEVEDNMNLFSIVVPTREDDENPLQPDNRQYNTQLNAKDALYISAIQELSKEIETLKTEVAALKGA